MNRPPLTVVLVVVLLLALGETGGALMSRLAPAIGRYADARVQARPGAHGLSGSAEYDDEVRARTRFAAEAGLSFFHTHAEGLGLVLFFTTTLVATLVDRRGLRTTLHAVLTAGALFPLGYLVYAIAVLEAGRDAGIELSERWGLSPLGLLAIAGLTGLALTLIARARRGRGPAAGEPR